jgi:hypothetical protein
MKLEQDTFRIELRSAKLCMELDCNTIFDARMYRHCPTCGSVESYPLEAWLNRERSRKSVRAAFGVPLALHRTAPQHAAGSRSRGGPGAASPAEPAPRRLIPTTRTGGR